TIVLFVNAPSLFDATYQRYLLNVFREKLPFKDIPVKLYLRARSQTDPVARAHARDTGDDLIDEAEERQRPVGAAAGPGDSGFDFASEVNDLLSDLDD
ncbi:MAG TPA: ribosome biogenesis GTPase Der, partial [Isosphaeraceae bacterium]|nr:ribosome biogenesis GTPase Der [Isosphaeraceae bacterium]